jgi:cytosolic carboxypeptidase protein 2/3
LARQHSSEVNSSFLVEELLYALAKRGNYKIAWLLDNFEFRIYPMVNVDGVIYGNTRTDLFGCDLNRVWRRPLKELQPQIYSIKK